MTPDQHFWTSYGERLCENGYHAFPLRPCSKKSTWPGWQKFCATAPTPDKVKRWAELYGDHSVAIACGHNVLAIDIDELDAARAYRVEAMAFLFLGETSMIRVGRAPKRILLYAVEGAPIGTWRHPAIDILGMGSYFVAYGIHPDTKKPYVWQQDSPFDMATSAIPHVTNDKIDAFKAALEILESGKAPQSVASSSTRPFASRIRPFQSGPWIKDERGLVIDGRDAFLARCVFNAAAGKETSADRIADLAWSIFEAQACLKRPKRDGERPWTPNDALAKARALLRKPLSKRHPRKTCRPHHESGFWTQPTKAAFQNIVFVAGARRQLPPAAVKVSEFMLGLVYADGYCFANVETIAAQTRLSTDTVKKARRRLKVGGFWLTGVHLDQKTRRVHGLYLPNPAVLQISENATDFETSDDNEEQFTLKVSEEPDWDEFIVSR